MHYSCCISSKISFSTFLPLILIALFAVTFSACDSPAGNALDANALNTQAEGFEFDETDIIYNSIGGGYLGGGSSKALNNKGLAAGDESYSDEEAYGVIWGKDTTWNVGGYYDGYAFSTAEDINDKQQVVGHDNYDAILWEGETRTELGNLGGGKTLPQAINEKVQIVGYSETANYIEHAFMWENGIITDLGTLCVENTESRATAINENGQIVGWSHTHDGVNRAFLWEDGKMKDTGIRVPDFYGTSGIDINDNGQIIIYQGDSKSILLDNGEKIDLDFSVTSINNKGQILGYTEDDRYIIWENGTITDITFEPNFEDGDSIIRGMSDLNDLGQVTGTVVNTISQCDPEDLGPECRDSGDHQYTDYGFILNTGL